MIWKIQPSPVFWIPMPFTNQNLMDLTAWQTEKEVQPQIIELSDPDTKENYNVEILDYLGPYPIEAIPTFIARGIGGKQLDGKLLAALLQKRKPEFRNTKRVMFYQVNPIKPNDSQETTKNS